ncbi:MAG: glycoside hydrolase [Bacteroidia bacterium]|nr:glycoside hydrolase [Bacteroidia bacterium]
MKALPYFILFLFAISYHSYSQKINGVNFVAEKTIISNTGFDHLININSKWVAWVPYAFCDMKTGHIQQNTYWQWQGETLKGCETAIQLAKSKGLKVMIKPHVWLSDHSYTGVMQLNRAQWLNWQTDYTKYILDFANLAQKYNVELFCIGTEQYASIKNYPQYWQSLIKEVRKVYKGKITYAGNWDTYKNCPFWSELDYIGIDAYFPISEKANPSIDELQQNWQKWKIEIYAFHKLHNKAILFTEFGYRSTEYATKEPWKDVTPDKYCESCQADAFQATFNTLWKESWIAGGFIWKWFEPNKSVVHENSKSYFVKEKLAEKTITKNFKFFK